MKRWQFTLLLAIGIACICLSLVTIVFARQNRQLQEAVQAQQAMINKGALSQQIGANLLREMAAAAQTDEKMRQLLKDNGYNLNPAVPASSPNP
jgi:Na+-translocating ferredoxin:NAD+ oxidoreductase RnfG subunit